MTIGVGTGPVAHHKLELTVFGDDSKKGYRAAGQLKEVIEAGLHSDDEGKSRFNQAW